VLFNKENDFTSGKPNIEGGKVMITLPSIDRLQGAKETIDHLKQNHPFLYEKLLHVVHLTRALQFKYHYLGCILLNQDCHAEDKPRNVYDSVLSLYQHEVQILKNNPNFQLVTHLFTEFEPIGYAKICLLILNRTPTSLVGPTSIK